MKFLTTDQLEILAQELQLKADETVFWMAEHVHEEVKEAYREGDKPTRTQNKDNPFIFHPDMVLTWNDIGKTPIDGANQDEAIDKQYWKEFTVSFPHGISLFLRPRVPDRQTFLGHEPFPPNIKISKDLDREKKTSGFSPRFEKHYYKLVFKGVLPDLQLIYDGKRNSVNTPPGHCTLTVKRTMTVHEFQGLIETYVAPNMVYIGPGLTGFQHR